MNSLTPYPDLDRKTLRACFLHAMRYLPARGDVVGDNVLCTADDRAFRDTMTDIFIRPFAAFPHGRRPLSFMFHDLMAPATPAENRRHMAAHRLNLATHLVINTIKSGSAGIRAADPFILGSMTNLLKFDVVFRQTLIENTTRPSRLRVHNPL